VKDKIELLWRLYQEHCAWERHQEAQRSSATNFVLVVAAAVLSIITINKSTDITDLPLTIFLVLLGVFGVILSMKYYERFARHQTLAGAYRVALDQEIPEAQILGIRSEAERCHTDNYRLMHKWRLHWLWIGLHVAVALMGVVLTVGILIGWLE
jgi:predicted membrane channel-forming protein YqfA (hemolysin III family)